ncbi:MAG: hypothetical protein BWY77_01405 [bacterium ADurb.Bin431]|nr:MAG: hypothetical protein BWY77_01405 [bacterium ADurb.Bin431]
MAAQLRDILLALAKWREIDVDDADAIIEILAEKPLADAFSEVLVSGGDDADVDRLRPGGTDRFDLAGLQDAQQLGLRRLAEVADLVKKKAAPRGLHEFAVMVLGRPGEGSLAMSEEFALDEGVGNGGAVDAHKGSGGAMAAQMDSHGDQFLARAGLAGDQNGALGGGHLVDARIDILHPRAGADHAVAVHDLGGHPVVLLLQLTPTQGALHGEQHPLQIDRLFEKIERPQPCRLDGAVDRGVAGNYHQRQVRGDADGFFEHLHAVQSGHGEIDEANIQLPAGDLPDRFVAVARQHDLIILPLEHRGQLSREGAVVLGDEHSPLYSLHTPLLIKQNGWADGQKPWYRSFYGCRSRWCRPGIQGCSWPEGVPYPCPRPKW